jgi:hypothetical protein
MTLPLTGAGPTGSAVAAFDPLSLSPVVWFKADAGTSTTTDGAAVSSWADQSGNARNATQATGSLQPAYKAAIQNGLPILRWSGSFGTNLGVSFGATLSQPTTMFLVFSATGRALNPKGLIDGDGVGGRNALAFFASDETMGQYAGTTILTGAAQTIPTGFMVMSALFNGASSQVWKNGTSYLTGNPGANSISGLTIGNRFSKDTTNTLQGDIGELLVYNSALSVPNRQSVESYLATRWGL